MFVEVELDPLRAFCPQVGCDTICQVYPDDGDPKESAPVRCPKVGSVGTVLSHTNDIYNSESMTFSFKERL